MRHEPVTVVGAGLAGSEAAWQLAQEGISVILYEMRPQRKTEAHKTDRFAELVCSNSFGSDAPAAASRILKDELTELGAFVLSAARKCAVPAGASLAVDRDLFASFITETIANHSLIEVRREEIATIPEGMSILATGPLTTPSLAAELMNLHEGKSLYFYDAISPIVSADSLDFSRLFFASRYDKGTPDFLNIPLTKEQYERFVSDLLSAEVVLPHEFEEEKYFESCMPIEAIAARGKETLAFGPMKPVGLTDPSTGKRPHAVVQLRAENRYRTAYNLVGFQTKMRYKEQERVFRTLPGLENAEFLRLGSMHRNTYIDSPRVLEPTLRLKSRQKCFVAGQLTGTEGYLESSATGLLAALNVARVIKGEALLVPPEQTMLGALVRAITDAEKQNFQPLNSNMGILPPLTVRTKGKPERNRAYADRALASLNEWVRGSSAIAARRTESYRPATLPQ